MTLKQMDTNMIYEGSVIHPIVVMVYGILMNVLVKVNTNVVVVLMYRVKMVLLIYVTLII